MPAGKGVQIMDAVEIDRALTRIAHEILERDGDPEHLPGLKIVGIRTRGVPLAQRLAAKLGEVAGTRPPIGLLDINLYRDDLSFDQLCDSMANVYIDFLDLYRRDLTVRIIDRLNSVKIGFFS